MDSDLSTKVPSNEEVVDELTKNLGKSSLNNQNISSTQKLHGVRETTYQAKQETTKDDNSSKDESKEINNDETEDEYFVDELKLKDRDVNLTEEEKELLKKRSDDFKTKGNALFKDGDYKGATETYTEGLRKCPLSFENKRAVLYANRAASKAKLMTDRRSVIADCTKAIELDSNYVKAYLRRAYYYEEIEKLDEALADYQKVLSIDPTHTDSIYAVKRLEPLINERNEKLKTEMLGKLKDLGNMILKPFGLSTNNFQLQQDQESGGYSVKFNQNPR